MSAHKELTAALAAVRMSEERRVSIARLVERAINEAVDGPNGATRINAAFLRGYVAGAEEIDRRTFDALNETVATIRGASRGGVAVARSARDDHTMEHGHASDVNVIDARAIIEHAKEKTP